VVLPPIDIIEVDALRTVLLKAASLIGQERDAARDAQRRMVLSAEAAEHANRAKSEFLASINPELRTPLHGILGYAELLRLEGGLNPRQSERLKIMMAAGTHLLGMINAVLDMSQIEANQMELHPEAIKLSDFARACLDVVRPAAETKGLALVLAPATPLRLFADPTRLRQVLVNLLGNAVKFTSAGSVEVRLRAGATVRLEVVDTGPGIPAGRRDKLFQSFERLDGNALRAIEGAGLGLALSARLVALMGGRLGHEDNPGGGSIFWLELPVSTVAVPLPAMATASAQPGNPIADNPIAAPVLHVLVVDDVAMNRDIASSFLCSAGHKVTCAENGEAAIAAVATSDCDVVLMDFCMPGMDGLEATRRIRLLQGPRGRVPIVDSHLGKPFDQAQLLAVVARAAEAGPSGAERLDPAAIAEPMPPATGSELPVLDQRTFELAAACLTPDAVASHLRTIAELGHALLRDLPAPDAPTRGQPRRRTFSRAVRACSASNASLP
jgi:CheY-like chemotaxis protein/nitrogen-specific signal transduction histidine kinase